MQSTYISGLQVTAPRSRRIGSVIAAISIILSISLSFFAIFSIKENKEVDAGGFACASVGGFMSPTAEWGSIWKSLPHPDATGSRVLTLEQAFGGQMFTPIYFGETSSNNENNLILANTNALDSESKPLAESKQRYAKEITGVDNSANLSKMQDVRTVPQCFISPIGAGIGGFLLILANFITSFMSLVATFAFDTKLICSDPSSPSGNCFNLVGVIGGAAGNGNGGIIGALTGSIYMPMMIIAVAIAAFSIGWKGIVKHRYREALGDTAWAIVSVFFGVIFLMNPQLVAKAPMVVSNSIAACTIGAFNGVNCLDSSSSSESFDIDQGTSNNVCQGNVAGLAPDEQMSMVIGNMGCSIWKAFILQPYSQINFGTSFEDMDVGKTSTRGGELVDRAGLDPNDFCVSMKVANSGPISEVQYKQLKLSPAAGPQVCNLAAYQMYLQSNASASESAFSTTNIKGHPSDATKAMFKPGNYDPRWYSVIATTAGDDDMWQTWAKEAGSASIIQGGMAIITALFGSFVIIVASIFAQVFYLSSIILIAFAPLFLLFAIHPGKGKKIFLGWLEKIVSNILKYLASAFFVLVAIAFYSAILASSTNPMMTFVFVIIMTFALMLYRKELIELIGRVNMGGEQLGNKASEWASGKREKAKTFTAGAVGAAIGSVATGDTIAKGLKDGTKREAMRGTMGKTVASTVRQADRNTKDIRAQVGKNADVKKAEKATAEKEKDYAEKAVDDSNDLGNKKAADLDAATVLSAEAQVDIKDDSSAAQKLKVELEAAKALQVGPGAAERRGALSQAANAVDKADKFTIARMGKGLGEQANEELKNNEAAARAIADKIALMPRKDADERRFQNAERFSRDYSNLSEAIRTQNTSEIDKIHNSLGIGEGADANDTLKRLGAAKDSSIKRLGDAELEKENKALLTGQEVTEKLETVERGESAKHVIKITKADLHLSDSTSDDVVSSRLETNRETAVADLATKGVAPQKAAQWVSDESKLMDAPAVTMRVKNIEEVSNKQNDLDNHYKDHTKLEENYADAHKKYKGAESASDRWQQAVIDVGQGKVNAKNYSSIEKEASEAAHIAAGSAGPVFKPQQWTKKARP